MYHEFIKIKKEDIPNRFNYSLISNYTSIKVSDDIILNNSLFITHLKYIGIIKEKVLIIMEIQLYRLNR